METNIVADKTCECLNAVILPDHAIVTHPVTGEKYAISTRCHGNLVSGSLPPDCKLYGKVNFNPVVPDAAERKGRGDTTLNAFGQEYASPQEAEDDNDE